MMCALYGVTRGGFYAWQAREPSARSLDDAELIEHVTRIHRDSRGFYGSPRVARKLCQQGVVIGRRRVSRLMRLARLQGRSARLYRRSRVGQHTFFASIANRQRAATQQATDQIWGKRGLKALLTPADA
jgi:putative transposase